MRDRGLHAVEQLVLGERLGEVVAATEGQRAEFTFPVHKTRQYQVGRAHARRAQAPYDLIAVDVRQHHVQKDEVVGRAPRKLQRILPKGGGFVFVDHPLKHQLDLLHGGGVVFDVKYPHG